MKLPENRHSSARVSGGDEYLCMCQSMAGMQRVAREPMIACECLDALSTECCVARATLLEEKLSAQHQALRHHPRPVARRRQDLRLLQDEKGELRVSPTGGETSHNPVSSQGTL